MCFFFVFANAPGPTDLFPPIDFALGIFVCMSIYFYFRRPLWAVHIYFFPPMGRSTHEYIRAQVPLCATPIEYEIHLYVRCFRVRFRFSILYDVAIAFLCKMSFKDLDLGWGFKFLSMLIQ